ncbi:MAG: 3-hydroxyacyl-CoA dehydrogenase NAD-binding domain-containing protein [Caldimonas sp.]
MNVRNIAVVGLGTLGTQIAIQAAAYGHRVSGFDPDGSAFQRMQTKVREAMRMTRKGPTFPIDDWEQHSAKVEVHKDLASALREADLVIEVVPEDLAIKRAVFAELDRLAPREAILATNSSTMPVSRMESATRRPARCVNIHFYQPAVGMNMADVMGGTSTTPETLAAAREFVRSVQCVPLSVQKEILGFCFNSVWRAVKRQTLYMWANEFVDFRDLDRAWMVFTGMTYGPFFLMDLVGLDVILAVERIYFKDSGDPRDAPPGALAAMVERGELGVKSGKGFYTYPDPECARDDFLLNG